MKLVNLSKKYKNTVFESINYTFNQGNIYSVFGKNGVGKTTLLNIMSKFVEPDNGYIEYTKNENDIVFIGEDPIPFELLTGEEFIDTTLKFKRINTSKNIIDKLFKDFEIIDFKDTIIINYSKGMKFKLIIILIILINPKVLILDEPFTDVDLITIEKVKKIFYRIKINSLIIFSTHLPNIAFKLSNKILYLTNKRLIEINNNFTTIEDMNNYIFQLMK
ncbi:MAG: ATP-binding cassette domain-containing protein [Clostridium tyrobutyricum]|jgi:ABC-type multidrug transport system ATPase subunit|uniref:ATP-binding cassette domain-containing protein n=1 Tax=Clostridium tyrobutyricum TaxID=1519 RepID=UPI00242AC733|nr:ATP-binding cassette domain-containing protein [Clostridium tyrobutyricum]MCH4199615.1 ATP-binding cassette domain-containing protein [Clostridium tyrobutyricum]MCH4259784.1 ATP-binding cassette domain-containing protein [Clostridium tyrobutyricum]MCI1239673.1 ATP-binding cassette domain-containing protein [Clostridium tyrobutyricum]MCI1652373.1 ATP-binding cassette domain-containing protein [Clostridium tyrobutyricum]MCI1938082.1 ATP-binding cassette domain-containing protein [Clostridium 